MDVFAYCAWSMRESVRQAAGVAPMTCPPVSALEFEPGWLRGHDFVYFKLHGLRGQPFWYGDEYQTAVTASQLRSADLAGAVVFVANCHLEGSAMLAALLEAGAKAVIGGPGANYALKYGVNGADLLGLWLRREARTRRLATYTLATTVAILGSGGLAAALAAAVSPFLGLAERITIAMFLQWTFALGLAFYAWERRAARGPAGPG